MKRRGNLKLAYRSLQEAKTRSLLTMLGIVIGVMAVVMVVCIGQGIKQQISGQIGQYGKGLITVRPGGQGAGSALLGGGLPTGASGLLAESDLTAVQKTHGIAYAAPLATATGSMTGDYTVNAPFIVATTADFPNIITQPIDSGGFFDNDSSLKTVVLGTNIAHKLFKDNAPLGERLRWRGQDFIVAGVYSNFNAPPFSLEANFNDAVFVPYATAESVSGTSLGIYEIVAKAESPAVSAAAIARTQSTLRGLHGGADDTTVQLASAGGSASDQTIHLLTLLITGAAIIALVVGGVGIMDVMLVSVTERMHEIGIRKAIGATNQQILRQFMAEAFVLSTGGALIGVVFSLIAIGLMRVFTSLHPALVWQVFILSPLASIAIGVLFGTAPAMKAARKDPIDALRQE